MARATAELPAVRRVTAEVKKEATLAWTSVPEVGPVTGPKATAGFTFSKFTRASRRPWHIRQWASPRPFGTLVRDGVMKSVIVVTGNPQGLRTCAAALHMSRDSREDHCAGNHKGRGIV